MDEGGGGEEPGEGMQDRIAALGGLEVQVGARAPTLNLRARDGRDRGPPRGGGGGGVDGPNSKPCPLPIFLH
jgi:hypothetical protein